MLYVVHDSHGIYMNTDKTFVVISGKTMPIVVAMYSQNSEC